MLRLQYALACENAIIAENGVTSLIAVLEKVEATLPSAAPEKLIIPMKWSFVCLWTRDGQDYPKPVDFEQEITVALHNGDEFSKTLQPFTVSNQHINFRNVTEFQGFPIASGGPVTIAVRIRKAKGRWSDPTRYTIMTERKLMEAPIDDHNKIRSNNGKGKSKS